MTAHRTIVIADHHKSIFVCQILDRETGAVERRTLQSSRSVLEPFLRALEGPVLVFIEACRSWEWVGDLCEELGCDFRLIDPRQMPEISKSRKKTDQADVEAMVRRFLVQGDLPRAYNATRSERELRGLTRQLSKLRQARRDLLLQIHAEIDAHGLPSAKKYFHDLLWRRQMEAKLSEDCWLILLSLLQRLDFIDVQRELFDSRIQTRVAGLETYRRLQTVPGIGPIIAATIVAEVPNMKRFGSARQFASYCGLVPSVRSSAGKARMGSITKSGPRDLRWALGHAVFVGRNSDAVHLCRRKKAQKKAWKAALCAGANKLARIIWAMCVHETDYESRLKLA